MYVRIQFLTLHPVYGIMMLHLCLQQGESSIATHEVNNMSELSIEYAAALEREKELSRRYDDLFTFLHSHVKESQVG